MTKYLIDGKLKMSGFFIFEIKRAKMDKESFLHNEWPYGYDFWHVFRD